MAKTHDELLAMANEVLELWSRYDSTEGTSLATFALACVALAKELPDAKDEGIVLHFKLTGEVRPPLKGEWFINPYTESPRLADSDWECSAQKILRVVDE